MGLTAVSSSANYVLLMTLIIVSSLFKLMNFIP